ncbi:hypothetical protein GCM10010486_09170 [Nonomuraea roseoviolacea subsp. carminata]
MRYPICGTVAPSPRAIWGISPATANSLVTMAKMPKARTYTDLGKRGSSSFALIDAECGHGRGPGERAGVQEAVRASSAVAAMDSSVARSAPPWAATRMPAVTALR